MFEGIIQGKSLAASGLVQTGPGRILGMSVSYDAGVAADLILYDNTAGSGTVIWQSTLAADAGTRCVYVPLNLNFSTGLYAALGARLVRVSFSYT